MRVQVYTKMDIEVNCVVECCIKLAFGQRLLAVQSERGNESLHSMKGIEFTEQLTKEDSVPWRVLIIHCCEVIMNLIVTVRITGCLRYWQRLTVLMIAQPV